MLQIFHGTKKHRQQLKKEDESEQAISRYSRKYNLLGYQNDRINTVPSTLQNQRNNPHNFMYLPESVMKWIGEELEKHNEIFQNLYSFDYCLDLFIEGFQAPDMDSFTLDEIDKKLASLDYKTDITLDDGTQVYEGYFNPATNSLAHFSRFQQIESREIYRIKLREENASSTLQNDLAENLSLEVQLSEVQTQPNEEPTFSYFAGFWITPEIFKGIKIFPKSLKIHAGTFIMQKSPFSTFGEKKLSLNGFGIKFILVKEMTKVQVTYGTFLYGMDHTFDPRLHIKSQAETQLIEEDHKAIELSQDTEGIKILTNQANNISSGKAGTQEEGSFQEQFLEQEFADYDHILQFVDYLKNEDHCRDPARDITNLEHLQTANKIDLDSTANTLNQSFQLTPQNSQNRAPTIIQQRQAHNPEIDIPEFNSVLDSHRAYADYLKSVKKLTDPTFIPLTSKCYVFPKIDRKGSHKVPLPHHKFNMNLITGEKTHIFQSYHHLGVKHGKSLDVVGNSTLEFKFLLDRKHGFAREINKINGDVKGYRFFEIKHNKPSIFLKRTALPNEGNRIEVLTKSYTGDFLLQLNMIGDDSSTNNQFGNLDARFDANQFEHIVELPQQERVAEQQIITKLGDNREPKEELDPELITIQQHGSILPRYLEVHDPKLMSQFSLEKQFKIQLENFGALLKQSQQMFLKHLVETQRYLKKEEYWQNLQKYDRYSEESRSLRLGRINQLIDDVKSGNILCEKVIENIWDDYEEKCQKQSAFLKVQGSVYQRVKTKEVLELVKAILPNKMKYQGWVDGRDMAFNGDGVLTTPSGYKYSGIWREGFLDLSEASEVDELKTNIGCSREYIQISRIEDEIKSRFSTFVQENCLDVSVTAHNPELFENKTKEQIKDLIRCELNFYDLNHEDEKASPIKGSSGEKISMQSMIKRHEEFKKQTIFPDSSKQQFLKEPKAHISNKGEKKQKLNFGDEVQSLNKSFEKKYGTPYEINFEGNETMNMNNNSFVPRPRTKLEFRHYQTEKRDFLSLYQKCQYKYFGVEVSPDFSTVRIGKFSCNQRRIDFVGIYYTHFERESNFLYNFIPTHSFPVNNKNFCLFVSPDVVSISDTIQKDVFVTLTSSEYRHKVLDYSNIQQPHEMALEHSIQNEKSYPDDEETVQEYEQSSVKSMSSDSHSLESNYESKRNVGSNSKKEHSFAGEDAEQEVLSQFNSGDGLSMISNTRNGNVTTKSAYQASRITHLSEERASNKLESRFGENYNLENEEELFREESLENPSTNRNPHSATFEEQDELAQTEIIREEDQIKSQKYQVYQTTHHKININSSYGNLNKYFFSSPNLSSKIDMRKTIDRFKFNGPLDDIDRAKHIRDCTHGIIKHQFWDGSEYEGQVMDYVPAGLGIFWDRRGWGFKGVWQKGILIDLIEVFQRFLEHSQDLEVKYKVINATFEDAYWSIRKEIEDSNRDWVLQLLRFKDDPQTHKDHYFDGNLLRRDEALKRLDKNRHTSESQSNNIFSPHDASDPNDQTQDGMMQEEIKVDRNFNETEEFEEPRKITRKTDKMHKNCKKRSQKIQQVKSLKKLRLLALERQNIKDDYMSCEHTRPTGCMDSDQSGKDSPDRNSNIFREQHHPRIKYGGYNKDNSGYTPVNEDLQIRIYIQKFSMLKIDFVLIFTLKDPVLGEQVTSKLGEEFSYLEKTSDTSELNFQTSLGYLLRSKINEYYLGHFLQAIPMYANENSSDSTNTAGSRNKSSRFEKLLNTQNKFFYLGEDRISKNFCRGEFLDNKTNGIAYLQKPTYYMKGRFRDSHLTDGEIKYINHIGDSVLVKSKVNLNSQARGYIDAKEPDFSQVLRSLVKSKSEINIMDISQILANSCSKEEANRYLEDIEEYRRQPWSFPSQSRPEEFFVRNDLFTKEGYILTIAPVEPFATEAERESLKNHEDPRFEDEFCTDPLPSIHIKLNKCRNSNYYSQLVEVCHPRNKILTWSSFSIEKLDEKICQRFVDIPDSEFFWGIEKASKMVPQYGDKFDRISGLIKVKNLKFGSIHLIDDCSAYYNVNLNPEHFSLSMNQGCDNQKRQPPNFEKETSEEMLGKREIPFQQDSVDIKESSLDEATDVVMKKLKVPDSQLPINKEYRGGLISRFRQGLGQFVQNLSDTVQTKIFGEQWAGFRHGFNFKSIINRQHDLESQQNSIEGQYEFGYLNGICKIDLTDPCLGRIARYVGYVVKDQFEGFGCLFVERNLHELESLHDAKSSKKKLLDMVGASNLHEILNTTELDPSRLGSRNLCDLEAIYAVWTQGNIKELICLGFKDLKLSSPGKNILN